MGLIYEPRLYPKKAKDGWGWGGRADLLAEIESQQLNGVFLLDWKSGKKPAVKKGYAEWPLQVAGYRQAVYDYKDIKCDGGAVIHLDKFTGDATVFDYSASFERDIEAFILLARFWHNRNPNHIKKGLPSCTTITGSLDKPALKGWAAKLTAEYVVTKGTDYIEQNQGMGSKALYNIAMDAKKNYMKMSEKAMSIGTEVHKYIEDFLKDGIMPKKKFMNIQARTAWEAWLKWYDTVKLTVIDLELNVYGRFDTDAAKPQRTLNLK